MKMRIKTSGVLKFNHKWAWLECCLDTILYYQWFLKSVYARNLNIPIWGSHITVIRDSDHFDTLTLEHLYQKEIEFFYCPDDINTNGSYWWVNVDSPEIESIRSGLGLNPIPEYDFHLTIGKEIPTRFYYV